MSIQTTNPATNKVLKSFDEMTDEQVEAQSKSLTPSLSNMGENFTTIGQKYCKELMRQRKTIC
jgi:succinate-semialdehyde dehydrogenase/glutarate-semialdehyde dehydrogenase